jgi:hypothetical protein
MKRLGRITWIILYAALASLVGIVFAYGQSAVVIEPKNIDPLGSSVVEASHSAWTGSGHLASFHVDTGSTAIWVMVYDGTSVPSSSTLNGCVSSLTARPCILTRYQFPANNSYGVDFGAEFSLQFTTGLIFLCSTTGPFVFTSSASCTFANIQVQK